MLCQSLLNTTIYRANPDRGEVWLRVDGQFGPLTHANVCYFQMNWGLKDDGIVGPRTWSTLLRSGGDNGFEV